MHLFNFHAITLASLLTLCGLLPMATAVAQAPATQTNTPADVAALDANDPNTIFAITNGSIAADAKQPGIYQWHIPAGQTSTLAIKADYTPKNIGSLLSLIRQFEKFNLQFNISSGSINQLSIEALGIVSGPRSFKQAQWDLAIFTTSKSTWHTRTIDLARPSWLPWDDKDGLGRGPIFEIKAMALEPDTVVELRGLSFSKDLIRLKPVFESPATWPLLTRHDDGGATYVITQHIQNTFGKPAAITARISELPEGYETGLYHGNAAPKLPVSDYPKEVTLDELGPGKTAMVHLVAHLSTSQLKNLPELATSKLAVEFSTADISPVTWRTSLTRPLGSNIKRQVLLADNDIAAVRQAIAKKDEAIIKALEIEKIISAGDEMAAKEFLALPRSQAHVRNNWIGDWRVADRMPEIVNTKTGEKEFGSYLAGHTWKEYLGHRGQACDNLAMAYLYTGDEKYAQAAARLFTLYAQQYEELGWTNINDAPWSDNPATLSASRTAISSSYGSNWYFKGHARLLSAITGSKAWTPELQQQVYQGFILPYATELMKFPGPISNMADITNHNVLLLGFVFDDANLVNWALNHDAGVLSRLNDINAEGFSSEGRTITYHLAGLTESIPSLGYAVRSGLQIDLPVKRLAAALAMPFERAALNGIIPSYGDAARGLRATTTPLADDVLELAPNEKWLADIGRGSSVPMILSNQRPARDAWLKRLETKPRLYPETGFAILRTGDTADDQIMATLDWGRSVFHAHLDRNQITLQAFGKIFSQGPGSLYNVGSGGITKSKDPKLNSFAGQSSLSHNVILVDQLDQSPAYGKLLAWNAEPNMQVAISEVKGIAKGVSHTRALVLTHQVVVMLDRIQGEQTHTYDFIYHNLGTMTPASGWTVSPVDVPLGNTANYPNLTDLSIAKSSNAGSPIHLTWDLTQNVPPARPARKNAKPVEPPVLPVVKLDLWQLAAKEGKFYTATTGLNNTDNGNMPDTAPSLIQRVQGKEGFFATVLEPNKGTSRIKSIAAAGNDGVTIQFTDGKSVTLKLDELIKRHAVK